VDLQAVLLRSAVKSYEDALRLTEVRRKGGLASDSDVEQARAQLAETRAQLVDLAAERAVLEHAIAVLVGQSATSFHLAESPLAGDPPSVPTGVPSQLLQRRPDVAEAERRVASANAQIGVNQAAYYPAITLGVGAGIESSVISTLMNPASALWSAGAQAAETVFDGGRRKSTLQFSYAQREQQVALYRQQVLSAIRDVEDQLSTLRTLSDEAKQSGLAVTAARRSTELSTIRYRRGLAAYLEVITNQTIELTDERAAAAVQTRRLVASAQLQIALGGGWNASQLPPN
jgi:NodT family efflux transporter outer membrane factor (OMF) lipoprotein